MKTVALCLALLAAPAFARARSMRMTATAYAQDSKPTAAKTVAREGIVAADPAVLPLGSRIRVSGAGRYSGIYVVTDTGRKIGGREIDIYMPSSAAAKRFGKKPVRVTILREGKGKKDARRQDAKVRALR